MDKQEPTYERLDLTKYDPPSGLVELYDALQEASGWAMQSVKNGETRLQREWRLASRVCREFLSATEEPAELAYAAKLGDWETARAADNPPKDVYTFHLWLAAQAWRLLQCCFDEDLDRGYIEPVRQYAREGVIAAKSIPSLQRIYAQRVANGDSKIEDRERGPELEPAGKGPALRLVE